MKTNWRTLSALCAAGFAVLTLATDSTIGQIVDYDGGGADSSWNTPENWDGDTVPTGAQTGRLDSGDSVVVDSNVNVGEVDSTDASLDLASGIFAVSGTLDLDSTGVTRSGGSFTAGTLIVSGSTQMTYEGADSTTRLQAIDGGELTVMKNINVLEGQVTNGGRLAVAAIFNAQGFDVFEVNSSGVLSLDTGGTFEGELLIDGGILERNGGLFDISMLDVNNSAVTFAAGDQIEDLMLSSSATAQVVQADGEFEGLIFTGTDIETELLGAGNLEVVFDDILLANQLDVGLQVAGDQQTELQALIDSGRITFSGGAAPAEVIFDGTNTVLGIVAVPEPGTGIVLIALGLCGLARRSRNRS